MSTAVKCTFDIMTYYLQDETVCYITPIYDEKKIMRTFSSSFEMLRFLKEKEFIYDSETFTFRKNDRIYVLWIM